MRKSRGNTQRIVRRPGAHPAVLQARCEVVRSACEELESRLLFSATPLVATNDNYSTGEFTALVVKAPGVLGNDSGPAGETLTASLLTAPTHGSVTFDSNGDGGFDYVPNANYIGPDPFSYKVADSDGLVATATVNMAVTTGTPSSGSLSGTTATAAASYNLTALGTSDWVHWGRGNVYGNFDHKATGGSQISNVSIVGTGANYGSYYDPSRTVTWSDGTPTASDTDHAYIWSNGALNSGFSFTVPADTTTRTLTVYAGGNNTQSSLTAHLSGGSVPDYVATAGSAGLYTNVYTITYSAASAGQTLTITLLKTGNLGGKTNGSADLIAAYLSGSAAPATGFLTANSIVINPPSVTQAGTHEVDVTVTYNDPASPIVSSSINASNIDIYSPPPSGGLSVGTVATQISNGGHTITATYPIDSNEAGGFNAGDDTTVKFFLTGVTDQLGQTVGGGTPFNSPAGQFTILINPNTSSASLSGSQAPAASSYNLTALGTSDWVHWGRGNVYGHFDHKATGGSQISNVSIVGTGANYGSYYDPSRTVTWSDGTPTASDTDHAYIWSNGALNSGFSFTVPADTTTRTLTVYAGGNNTQSSLTAHLSGGSVPDYVATAGSAGLYTNVYTITYSAASAGQTLTITLLKTGNLGGKTNGSADLIAAYLT